MFIWWWVNCFRCKFNSPCSKYETFSNILQSFWNPYIYDRKLMAMCGIPPHLPSPSYRHRSIYCTLTSYHCAPPLNVMLKSEFPLHPFLDMSIVFSSSNPSLSMIPPTFNHIAQLGDVNWRDGRFCFWFALLFFFNHTYVPFSSKPTLVFSLLFYFLQFQYFQKKIIIATYEKILWYLDMMESLITILGWLRVHSHSMF
jgi:hypothetical protein